VVAERSPKPLWTGFDSLLACQGSCPWRWKRGLDVEHDPFNLRLLLYELSRTSGVAAVCKTVEARSTRARDSTYRFSENR
jgi:hypothetical protein